MAETLQQQTVQKTVFGQPPPPPPPLHLQNTLPGSTNNDKKNVSVIFRLSIPVIFVSVLCFICGIVQRVIWFSIWYGGIWGPVLPFIAGVLGVLLRSIPNSSRVNGFSTGFSIAGCATAIVLIILESLTVRAVSFVLPFGGFQGFGIFIILCGAVLMVLLFVSSIHGFLHGGCCSEKKKTDLQPVVYVYPNNFQPGNFGFPQNQQYFVQPNGGNQPANIQMVLPSGNVNGAYQPSSPIATTSFPPQYKK